MENVREIKKLAVNRHAMVLIILFIDHFDIIKSKHCKRYNHMKFINKMILIRFANIYTKHIFM